MKYTLRLMMNTPGRLTIFALFLASLSLVSCSEKKTPGGVKYTVLRKGDGKEPEFGKYLAMYLELKDAKDSIWFSTASVGYPVVLGVPDESMEKDDGENGVFKQLTKGDSVTFQIPARIVFIKARRRPVPPNVDPLSLFTFHVGVKDIWGEEEVNKFQQRILLESEQKRAQTDSTTIANFLKEKGITAQYALPGIFYVVQKEGKGENALAGKIAYVNYEGHLLNGNLFDTNIERVAKANNYDNGGRYSPYPVVVNTESVIRGWDIMLQLMNEGMKVTVYIPSALAYGSRSAGPNIPPNSILVFDMEVVDIK